MSDVNLTEKQKDELDMLTVAIEREEGLNDEYHNKVHSFIVKYVDKFRLANGADSKTANCAIFDVSVECEHPYAYVHTRCMGEINHCLKCGKDL